MKALKKIISVISALAMTVTSLSIIPASAAKTTSISKCSVSLSASIRTYNGNTQQPLVTVTYNGKKLQQGTHYKVKYNNQVKIGKAYAHVWGIGSYSGSVNRYYNIVAIKVPEPPVASCTYNSITVGWQKVDKATGYVVQRYNTKTKKWISLKTLSSSKTSYKNTGLTPETQYKYRIKAYRKLNGKIYYTYSSNITKKTLPKSFVNDNYDASKAVLALVNNDRRARGLSALTMDPELYEVAYKRARYVAKRGSERKNKDLTDADHYYDGQYNKGFEIASKYMLVDRNFNFYKNTDHYYIGENLANGYTTSAKVYNGWKTSTVHWKNIIKSEYKRVGIACYTDATGTKWWVQVFAS